MQWKQEIPPGLCWLILMATLYNTILALHLCYFDKYECDASFNWILSDCVLCDKSHIKHILS